MSALPPPVAPVRYRPKRPPRRDVEVVSSTRITPHMVRIVAGGNLAAWPAGGPGAHFKVFVPMAVGGYAMRTYTVRAYDPARAELTIDFALDPGGPASQWAAHAAPGDRFQVSGQARGSFIPGGPLVIAGDASALPAPATILEQAPPGTAITALLAVDGPAERQSFDTRADLDLTWVSPDGDALLAALRDVGDVAPNEEFWIAAEASVIRDMRRHLLQERALAASALYTRAYWRAGHANHSDHDSGEEPLI